MNLDSLKTGDLILFTGCYKGMFRLFDSLISYGTHSNYTHVGIILRDPIFIHPTLKGLFVWQSGWNGKPDKNDGKIKLGVQVNSLKDVLEDYKDSKVIIRSIKCNPWNFNDIKLQEINNTVYNKPYDIIPTDWFEALVKKNPKPQKTDRFWCSALVGYIYTKCGILNYDTDWSILKPVDFSLDGENLKFIGNCLLENYEFRLN